MSCLNLSRLICRNVFIRREKIISNKLQSNDSTSTLTALLERAQTSFHENSFKDISQNNSHTSDQDSGVNTCRGQGDMSSCGEVTPPTGSPMVQSYIDSLQDPTGERNLENDCFNYSNCYICCSFSFLTIMNSDGLMFYGKNLLK